LSRSLSSGSPQLGQFTRPCSQSCRVTLR
jgi:hypothetical protein